MDFPELIKTGKTEQPAFDYLLSEIREINGIHCPSCGSPDYFLMNQKRLHCKNCRRDSPPFSGPPISGLKIFVVTLLLVIKLFELEISARMPVPNWISVTRQHSKYSTYSEKQ
jgi:transposase-like protein